MDEVETAISLLRKALVVIGELTLSRFFPGLEEVYWKLVYLLLSTGKGEEAISDLENAVDKVKVNLGPKHYKVGYAYDILGALYVGLDQPESSALVLSYAKDILDESLGPYHPRSIEVSQDLSRVCADMGSYSVAIELQEKVVEILKERGESVGYKLKGAVELLEMLKVRADCDEVLKCLQVLEIPADQMDLIQESHQFLKIPGDLMNLIEEVNPFNF